MLVLYNLTESRCSKMIKYFRLKITAFVCIRNVLNSFVL